MNASGDRIAVSSASGLEDSPSDPGDKQYVGAVTVYDWDGSDWVKVKVIEPEYASHLWVYGQYFGHSIALNATGDRIIIGAPKNNPQGHVNYPVTADRGLAQIYSI